MSEQGHRSEKGPASERWLARALLLPPLVLAWPGPGSVLRGDFLPHATGTDQRGRKALDKHPRTAG